MRMKKNSWRSWRYRHRVSPPPPPHNNHPRLDELAIASEYATRAMVIPTTHSPFAKPSDVSTLNNALVPVIARTMPPAVRGILDEPFRLLYFLSFISFFFSFSLSFLIQPAASQRDKCALIYTMCSARSFILLMKMA
jgi:hypothetical protein